MVGGIGPVGPNKPQPNFVPEEAERLTEQEAVTEAPRPVFSTRPGKSSLVQQSVEAGELEPQDRVIFHDIVPDVTKTQPETTPETNDSVLLAEENSGFFAAFTPLEDALGGEYKQKRTASTISMRKDDVKESPVGFSDQQNAPTKQQIAAYRLVALSNSNFPEFKGLATPQIAEALKKSEAAQAFLMVRNPSLEPAASALIGGNAGPRETCFQSGFVTDGTATVEGPHGKSYYPVFALAA